MTAVIAVANQKGGVAKTTTAVTLGHGAALRGLEVLLIDVDPQGNVTDSLGLPEGNDLIGLLEKTRLEQLNARPNLDVIRSDKTTASYKNSLAGRDYREYVLSESLEHLRVYDLIIIDCAPSVDVLHVAALTAADWLIVPTRLDQFAVKGVLEILRTVSMVNRRGGKCSLAGIVPTFYDRQTAETQMQLEHLVNQFGSQIWPIIPQDAKIRGANRAGKTLYEYAPKTRALIGIDGIGGGYESVLDRLTTLIR